MIAEEGTLLDRWIRGRVVLPEWNEVEESFIDEKTILGPWIERLYFAWADGSMVDPEGNIWLDMDVLFPIIRVSSLVDMARFAPGKAEQAKLEDRLFLRGQKVARVIDNVVAKVDRNNGKRELRLALNAEISKELYLIIRNSDRARRRQNSFYDSLREKREELKSARIRRNRITNDELTGEPMTSAEAEFAYVRMPSLYKELVGNPENGLVVKKETFATIRKGNVADERELGRLCDRHNWSKEWYKNYASSLEAKQLVR